jgi:hypothetical protein
VDRRDTERGVDLRGIAGVGETRDYCVAERVRHLHARRVDVDGR